MPHATHSPNKPLALIVMGVSGCGKSTLASHLAKTYGFEYVEADDYHTELAKSLMASGTPLTDAHREPWIQALCAKLQQLAAEGKSAVLAYSGLRAAHRARFRGLGLPVQFIHLVGDKDLIRSRMQARQNHFMPSGLVDSQFAALEPTDAESDVVSISVAETVAAIVAEATAVTEEFISQYG
ncbi:MAG TPA: gluconokinase, GntK/IdnK-type [Cellvibrionaceae bacterium]|nr:gluconokinase, GntK/IdnK-type [Cellvibrionaceae bacterium]